MKSHLFSVAQGRSMVLYRRPGGEGEISQLTQSSQNLSSSAASTSISDFPPFEDRSRYLLIHCGKLSQKLWVRSWRTGLGAGNIILKAAQHIQRAGQPVPQDCWGLYLYGFERCESLYPRSRLPGYQKDLAGVWGHCRRQNEAFGRSYSYSHTCKSHS